VTATPAVSRTRGYALRSLAVCLVAVAVLVAVRPDPVTDFRRSYADVGLNEPGRLRVFDVTVTSARRVVSVPRTKAPFTSDQALIIVGLEGAVRVAPTYFTAITLITGDGRSYEPRPEFAGAGPSITQPGFTTAGSLVFELPPSRLDGARLLVDPDGAEFDVYDAAVRVDLGLNESTPADVLDDPLPDTTTWVTR
jgi:hypothetical protein